MLKSAALLSLLCVVSGINFNIQTTPGQFFLSPSQNAIQFTSPAPTFQELVLNLLPAPRQSTRGFGKPSRRKHCKGGAKSFSAPPPPLDSNTDPQGQTCGLAHPFCKQSRYRSLDGRCNNLVKPTWGSTQTPYGRLTPYNYADGVSAMPLSKSGLPLPNPREISLRLFPDQQLIDPVWNLNTQQWGQIITHDMSLAGAVPQTTIPITCCDDTGRLAPDVAVNPACAPILVPRNDPIHSPQGTQCMNFIRTATTRDRGCSAFNAPAEQISTVTAFMDLSLVYGNSPNQADPLRAFRGGRMLTVVRGGNEWLPQDTNVTQSCDVQIPDEPCYLAGDIRVNQNTQLTAISVILVREHNRIADALRTINPHWNDEIIFQEARRINVAQIQHINYYEYLPILLGFENMVKNRLIYPRAQGYVNDYNPNVDPSVLSEHATAAFRHFHTLIRGYLKMIAENRNLVGVVRMSDWFVRPLLLELGNSFSDLIRGLTTQAQDFSDQSWDSEITQYLFRRNNTFGGDLRSLDIQRGRDHGLGTYLATRAACGLPVPKTFQQMQDYIRPEYIQILQSLYQSPEDVDLVVGGSLERNVPGAQAGPTYLCILTEQFYRTRAGDRFFYENGADPLIAFTPRQLQSIRQGASISRLYCDNSPDIRSMQPKGFLQISTGNEVIPCDHLPYIDLTLWQDVKRGF